MPPHNTRGMHLYTLSMIGVYILNFGYSWYLSRYLALAEVGSLALISTFLYITQGEIVALSRTVSYHTAYLLGKYHVYIKDFWKVAAHKSWFWGLQATALWLLVTPILSSYFHTDIGKILSFVPVIFICFAYAVDSGFLSGEHLFGSLALIGLVEVVVKILVSSLILFIHIPGTLYAAVPVSMIAAFAVGRIIIVRFRETSIHLPPRLVTQFPRKFYLSVLINRIAILGFLSIDMLFAKHFLRSDIAGAYAILSLVGKGIFFAGSLPATFLTPVISRESGEETTRSRSHLLYIGASIIFILIATAGAGLMSPITFPLIFGSRALLILPYANLYAIGLGSFALATTLITYYQAKNVHIYSLLSLFLTVIQVVLFSIHHSSVREIVEVVAYIGVIQLVAVLTVAQIVAHARDFSAFARDLISLLGNYQKIEAPPNSLKILIFNWRDTRHIWAGGAETYIHEIAREWIKHGHKVTLFCGNDDHCPRNEVVDGVQVIRRGGLYTVYLWAFLYYVLRLRGIFDVVIDCENGIPFFTPLYVRVPKFLLIFHVHQKVFREHLRTPLRQIAQFLEARAMPRVYAHEKVVTISPSTHDELISLGIATKRRLEIIAPGVGMSNFVHYAKTDYPSFLYVGRLKPYKNVDIAIRAFARIVRDTPTARFTIAGTGESRRSLKNLVATLHLNNSVTFAGHITDEEKKKLLSTSWAALQPSSYEGWGLTVIEANAAGTPVIASNVPGLKDAVIPDITGVLVPRRNDVSLAEAMNMLIRDASKRAKLSHEARVWAARFRWDESARKFIFNVYQVLDKSYTEASWPS